MPAGMYAAPHTPHGKMVRLKDRKCTFVNCVSFKKTAKPGNKGASIKVKAWSEMAPDGRKSYICSTMWRTSPQFCIFVNMRVK